jgi:hypothetical protein
MNSRLSIWKHIKTHQHLKKEWNQIFHSYKRVEISNESWMSTQCYITDTSNKEHRVLWYHADGFTKACLSYIPDN